MKKLEKIISVSFACFLVATATITGTLAYESLIDVEWAQTSDDMKSIQVALIQEQRSYDEDGNLVGLETFKDDKEIVPLVASVQYDGTNFDKYGMLTTRYAINQVG